MQIDELSYYPMIIKPQLYKTKLIIANWMSFRYAEIASLNGFLYTFILTSVAREANSACIISR